MSDLLRACDDQGLLGFTLWPRQRQPLLESLEDCPRQVWALGRRSGKTTLAALVMLHNALLRPDLDRRVRAGETRFAVAIATNLRQARLLVDAARTVIEGSPLLAGLLESQSEDELRFRLPSGARTALAAFPCNSRGARGWPISCLVMDEAAHFVSETDGPAVAERIFAALIPATAQFGDAAQVIVSSTPSGPDNFFAETFRKADSGALAGWRAWRFTTQEMNPTITEAMLAEAEAVQPETFASEFLAEFEAGAGLLFDRSRFEPMGGALPAEPGEGLVWVAGLDPAFSADSFGVALVARSRFDRGSFVLGPVLSLRPQHRRRATFEQRREAEDCVLAQVAEIARTYGAHCVCDQHQSQAVVGRLREHGIRASVRPMTGGPTGTLWATWKELRDRVHDGSLPVPDQQELVRELLSVRYKLDDRGGVRIILPRSGRGHCDSAQALAVAVHELRWRPRDPAIPRHREHVRPITYEASREFGLHRNRPITYAALEDR